MGYSADLSTSFGRIPGVHYFLRPQRESSEDNSLPEISALAKKRVPYLDGWRGMAILLVLTAHFYGIVYNLGYLGVDTFFVLSGLLMGRILFVDQVPLRTFYRNRIARIFPVYYLYLAVISFMMLHHMVKLHASDIGYAAIFMRTYLGDYSIWNDDAIQLSHTWSLNIEEHCYLLLSIISLITLRKNESAARLFVTAAALLCIGFLGYYKTHPPASPSPFFLRTECAGFSIFASAAIYLWRRKLPFTVPSYVPLAATALGFAIGAFSTHGFGKFIYPSLFLAIAVNTLDAAPAWFLSILSNPVLMWFGICSYSIYMWQQIFFSMVMESAPSIRVLGVCIAVAVGAFSFYFYEQPMRKRLHAPKRQQQ
ncbi:MAG TPA: acyltransferase [Rickettsiales bacterium]|nr:acyltransferase [Rickettsiales bacterium]